MTLLSMKCTQKGFPKHTPAPVYSETFISKLLYRGAIALDIWGQKRENGKRGKSYGQGEEGKYLGLQR